MKPLCVDMFTGLGGWSQAFLDAGYRVIGVDIEDMPAKFGLPMPEWDWTLMKRDILTVHGREFADATVIVASPPCFVADTLILTARGLLPIPEVMVGDLVLTHRK